MKKVSEPEPARESADFKEHYRTVLDNLPFPAWLKDTESRFLAVNEAFARTFGAVSAESLIGKGDFDTSPRDLAEAYRADDFKVIASRQKKMVEEEIVDQGVRKWFETYKAPVLDQHGEPLGTFGFTKDITERKKSEKALANSEERFRLIFENSGDAVIFALAEGSIDSANTAACKLFGYSEGELKALGRAGIMDLTDPRLPEALAERNRSGRFSGELRCVHSDGHIFPVELTSVFLTSPKGMQHSVIQIRDITERKENERVLKESEERFRLIFENSGEAILFSWEDGRIQSANQAACRMFGYSEEELRQRGRSGIIDTTDPHLPKVIEKRLTKGKFFGELSGLRSDGSIFPIELNSTLFTDTKGELRCINQFREITERKEAERRLGEQLSRLQLRDNALSAISQGVLITGVDQLITYANAGFEMLTGYSPAEVLGGNCEFLLGPDTSPETRDEVLAALAAGQPFHGEILVYRKDGTPFWNGLSVTPAFDDNGQLIQFVSVLRDITSRRQTEDELRHQAARIEAMSRHQSEAQEKMRRRLSADLHDRTSPNLAAISINLGILAEELAACGSADMADRMEDTRALIEDTVISIREISAELRPPLLDYAGLRPAMESYAQQFRRRTGIEVGLKCQPTQPGLDTNRESILFRIFQEALTNSAKHSRATRIEVSLTQDQHAVSLSIADNGIGFDPALLGAAPFSRGLGLINMKETAEFAGGTITVDAQPGKGTHIHVQF